MENGVLNISEIHPQWRLDMHSFEDDFVEPNDDKLKFLLGQLENRYQEWPISHKEATEKQLHQLVNSSLPVVFDSIIQTPKGRPFNSKTKKPSTSTTRDPLAFEVVDKSRNCSNCKGVGHNCRTCPHVTKGNNVEFHAPNPVESQNVALDVNSLPFEFFI
ncbi:hypothetical protein FRX31_027996 [Thalictrum thalictroides]|uniref:CCHC-type domain-containing protein n=1 Tax=Thalictrum thalictroides TaxID=46969 RepID=A0A7J6VCE2_THATH|nr:hypothetical protein FRX31_027996 [Thalictrum thalictroides]